MEIYEEIKKDREAGARRLVAEYRERLQAAAVLLCKDPVTAEDLVFRSFEQAIFKIDSFRPTGSFYYWIYTILLNFWRMDGRKKVIRPELVPNEELPEVADERPDPFGQMMFAGTAAAVRAAVQRLPDEFREVVVLRYFEEMSTPEIAGIIGVPDGTVRSRLHYAREALYAMLSSTELSPDFTDRLIRATRPRNFWGRRALIAGLALLVAFVGIAAGGVAAAKVAGEKPAPPEEQTVITGDVFNEGLWRMAGSGSTFSPVSDEIDRAVEQGLKFIASQPKEDGSFRGQYGETAALPALAGMAFLSKGHLPGSEPYGPVILKCIDRVLDCADMRDDAQFRGYMGRPGDGKMYSHSIATLFLSEVSGMVDMERQERIDRLLPLAVKVILDAQNQRKNNGMHLGGWRYQPNSNDSDLSCSGWALMALRSARLNGAVLPDDAIEKAVLYVKRSQAGNTGAFSYQGNGGQNGETLSGAGILCLELCGKHLDPDSLKAARFIERTYRRSLGGGGGFTIYGLYYAAQGLFQLGGDVWKDFEAWMYETYLKRQRPDGSWCGGGQESSPVYSTAMVSLAFTVPYRMLPIYQRDETVDAEEEDDTQDKEGKDKRK